jgi:hypothetical protein
MKSSLLIAIAVALCSLGWSQPMPMKDVFGPNNSFNDASYGVSVSYPQGWMVRDALRWGNSNEQNTVFFAPPPPSAATPSMYYQMFSPTMLKPEPGKIEGYLRDIAVSKEGSRIRAGLSDYKNVPESFAFKQIAGRPAASYFAVYTLRGQMMEEYFIRIVGEKGYVMFFVQGPAEDVSAIHTAVDRMAETVKVP